ncbi:hypothetical protein D3C77_378980 [compost metagenome]
MKSLESDASCIQQYGEQEGEADLSDNAQHRKIDVVEKRLDENIVLSQCYKIIQTDVSHLRPARPVEEPVIKGQGDRNKYDKGIQDKARQHVQYESLS